MYDLGCLICKRRRGDDPRAKYCSSRCRWRAYWQRSVRTADQIDALLPAARPPDAEAVLPSGGNRNLIMMQMALLGHAPSGARGYRLGIRYGLSQIPFAVSDGRTRSRESACGDGGRYRAAQLRGAATRARGGRYTPTEQSISFIDDSKLWYERKRRASCLDPRHGRHTTSHHQLQHCSALNGA